MTDNKKTTVVAGLELSEADIEAMKNGMPLSGAINRDGVFRGGSTFTPTQSIPIGNNPKQIRPNVAHNRPNEGLIEGPSPNFAGSLAKAAQDERDASRKAAADEIKKRESLSPTSLKRDLSATQRQVKRLSAAVKELQAELQTLKGGGSDETT